MSSIAIGACVGCSLLAVATTALLLWLWQQVDGRSRHDRDRT